MADFADIHALVITLAREAGDTAVERLRQGIDGRQKGDGIDVVTEVDIACEQRIIEQIQAHYPHHGITGEEHGVVCNPDASMQWLIDPLDGTNNYVLGMPMFGNCITVLENGLPVVAAVHESTSRITTSAYLGGGAWRNGQRTRIGSFPDLARTTVSWTQGYAVAMDDPAVRRIAFDLQMTFKRVLGTWSPSIDWSLIAAGRVGAVAAWRNELHDLLCGELIVAEAGGEIWRDEARDVVIAGAPEVVSRMREVMGV